MHKIKYLCFVCIFIVAVNHNVPYIYAQTGAPRAISPIPTRTNAAPRGYSTVSQIIDTINPLANTNLGSISGVINALIPLAMTIAGLILFLMLIAGGFQMLTSATDPKAADAGKQRITTALIGFLIVFASYWLVQILEIVLGINILGS